jgi:hypothetical protein
MSALLTFLSYSMYNSMYNQKGLIQEMNHSRGVSELSASWRRDGIL